LIGTKTNNNICIRGLYGYEIDGLIRRMLAADVKPYLDKDGAANFTRNRQHVRWLGVFARDELPDYTALLYHKERPFALVLNSDPRDKPGQHWLALFAPKNGPIELFDSFGQLPSYYSLDCLTFTFSR